MFCVMFLNDSQRRSRIHVNRLSGMNYYAQPRMTRDIDLVVKLASVPLGTALLSMWIIPLFTLAVVIITSMVGKLVRVGF